MDTIDRVRSAYGWVLILFGLLAGALLFATMLLVGANVAMRYLVNISIPGSFELTEAALPLIIFLSLALTQFHGGHIKVTLLTRRMPPWADRLLGIVGLLAGAMFFAWAAWAGWIAFMKSFAINEIERGSIRYPVAPIRFAVVLGMVLLVVQFLLDALTLALGGRLNSPHAEEVE